MRSLALIASLCACGDNGNRNSDAAVAAVDAGALVACVPSSGTRVTWRQIGTTAGPAIIVTAPPDDPRLFVVAQSGHIQILGDQGPTEFLDLSTMIASGGEQGLLGLAFHPQYGTNHTFYVFYTTETANVLARYRTSADDPNRADPNSGEVMISIPDFATNHNAGMLELEPAGDLYIATGDAVGERVIRGDRVLQPRSLVLRADPQDLREQRVRILAVEVWIAAAAAVAGRDVEVAIGLELEHAGVVVRREVRDRDHDLAAVRIGPVRIVRRGPVAGEHVRSLGRVEHVERVVGPVLGMKREPE